MNSNPNTASSHWYDSAGNPQHFVQCKTRDGTRPTTLADAKKNGWFPSVTTIIGKTIRSQGLEKYRILQAVHAVCTAPDVAGEGIDAKIERVLFTERQDEEESRKAMDLGSEIHQAIEEHCAGRLYAPQFKRFVESAMYQVNRLGRIVSSERVLVHPSGFAGRTDCITEGDVITVLDFKTSKKLPAKQAWPEALLQTAAYAASIGNTTDELIQTAVLYIDTINPGQTALFVTKDWQPHWCVFQHVFEVWKFLNGYDPAATKEAA